MTQRHEWDDLPIGLQFSGYGMDIEVVPALFEMGNHVVWLRVARGPTVKIFAVERYLFQSDNLSDMMIDLARSL